LPKASSPRIRQIAISLASQLPATIYKRDREHSL
jgi:hypothetical protein